MRRQYTSEELLLLRKSPLVTVPNNFPPVEEWMGVPPDQSQVKPATKRSKIDETPAFHDISNRRPSLFARGSSTIPEDIILAPPKTAFASASSARNTNKPLDSADRRSFHNHNDDISRHERYNFRENPPNQRDQDEIDHERPRDTRHGVTNGRRRGKEESEGWTNVRPRRSFGQEDKERFRREAGGGETERDRDPLRDFHDRTQRHDNQHGRDREHDDKDAGPRRNGFGRGRNEPTWFRDDKHTDSRTKEDSRDKEWREKHRGGTRGSDREWTRGGKVEQDPEWMDSAEKEGKAQAHTQEDFQRWKERMKANNAPMDEKQKPAEENDSDHHRSISANAKTTPAATKIGTPLVMDSEMDKFFGLFNDTKKEASDLSSGAPILSKKDAPKGVNGKSSRFTSFFTPQGEAPPQQPDPAAATKFSSDIPQDSSNEDKEGFQRILQMLGGASMGSGSDTPQINPSQQPLPPKSEKKRSDSPIKAPSPIQAQKTKSRGPSDNEIHTRGQKLDDAEGLVHSQTLNGGVSQNRDSEFLLKLMQQSRVNTSSSQPPIAVERPTVSRAPSTQQFTEILMRPKDTPKGKAPTAPPPGLFDGLSLGGYQRQMQENVQEASKQKPSTRPPPGFSEDAAIAAFQRPQRETASGLAKDTTTRRPPPGLFDNLSSSGLQRGQPLEYNHTQQNHPLLLQRPPGLEQPSAGWPGSIHLAQHHTPHQAHIPPPPGFGNPSQGSTSLPPGFSMPPPNGIQFNNIGNMPIYGDRGPTGSAIGSSGSGRGHPTATQPSMGPPSFPQYAGGPPPGFSPVSFIQDGMGPVPSVLHSSGPRQPQYEMFGEGGNMGTRGRGVPPGL